MLFSVLKHRSLRRVGKFIVIKYNEYGSLRSLGYCYHVVIIIICQGAQSEALRPLLNIPFLTVVLLIVNIVP